MRLHVKQNLFEQYLDVNRSFSLKTYSAQWVPRSYALANSTGPNFTNALDN